MAVHILVGVIILNEVKISTTFDTLSANRNLDAANIDKRFLHPSPPFGSGLRQNRTSDITMQADAHKSVRVKPVLLTPLQG
jgi:hypothetical protein